MKKKSYNLSIFLLKQNIMDAIAALKEPDKLESCEISIGWKSAFLFYRQNPSRPPSWVKLFKPHVEGDTISNLYNSGTAAVLIVYQSNRFFVITFGYGKSLLLPDCYEENFGLLVVLNSVDPDKLRSVDAQRLDAVPVQVRNQANIATSLSEFGIDIEQDLVYAATGQPIDSSLGKQISGKDAVKLSVPLDLQDLPALLGKLFIKFNETTYKHRFSWIDNLSEIRDPSLIKRLDDALSLKIKGGDLTRTWLSIPDIIEWSDVSGFQYSRRGELIADIDWESYLEFINNEELISVSTFKKHSVLCISEASEQLIREWRVFRCIYCELNFDEHVYALNNGKWYRVDPDFLKSVNLIIKEIPTCTLKLPAYTVKNEADYNKLVHESNSDYFALMDKEMIWYGNGSSQIEFCDLYTQDKHLIHVKRYTGSSVLSHLFSQGLVSTNLLLADANFREKVNEKLPASHQFQNSVDKPNAPDFEVVYAIASNKPQEHFELPLFSKINLRNCYKQLNLLGVRVSICIVPMIDALDKEKIVV